MPKTNVSAILCGIFPKKHTQSTIKVSSRELRFFRVRFFFIFIIDGAKKISDPQSELLSSSAVEQVTVNQF